MPPRTPVTSLAGLGVVTGTTPASRELATRYALPWQMIVKNESGGAVVALRVRTRTHEKGPWAPWYVLTSGLPIAAGDTLSLVERDTPSESIEVELTADDTGVASLWLVGV
jgi:hypothetical protein